MDNNEQIREKVSKAYARTVTTEKEASCCAPFCCGGGGVETAGIGKVNYSPSELEGVPQDASAHSLGCGNPLAFSQVREGETVLDLGSGAGIDLLIAAKKVGPTGQVIGIDMTDEMIEKARQNIESSGWNNVAVRRGLIEELPVENRAVDWVISNCVINLSPEKGRVFSEIFRVLKPGGRFRISDIVVEEFPDWLRDNEALYASCVAGAISENEYLHGLESAGLVDVEVTDRIVYDSSQLQAMAKADFFDMERDAACCGSGTTTIKDAVDALEGKVWSAIIMGRKPEAV
jgi:SAM-dependent methyltransferase